MGLFDWLFGKKAVAEPLLGTFQRLFSTICHVSSLRNFLLPCYILPRKLLLLRGNTTLILNYVMIGRVKCRI